MKCPSNIRQFGECWSMKNVICIIIFFNIDFIRPRPSSHSFLSSMFSITWRHLCTAKKPKPSTLSSDHRSKWLRLWPIINNTTDNHWWQDTCLMLMGPLQGQRILAWEKRMRWRPCPVKVCIEKYYYTFYIDQHSPNCLISLRRFIDIL